MMTRFEQGKIYKLVSDQTDQVYIGSTTRTLAQRKGNHITAFRAFREGRPGSDYYSSFEILQYNDARIELIEPYPCGSKAELLAREQHHIDNTPCVNKHKAVADPSERLAGARLWKQNNRAKNLLILRHWRENNQQAIKDYSHKYYAEKRDSILVKKRERALASATITCVCGGRPYQATREAQHLRSKCHQRYLLGGQDVVQPDPLAVR